MDLVCAVLVQQQLDELLEPLLGEVDEQTSRIAEVWVVRVEDVGSEESSKVDDQLLVGGHEAFAKSPDHLVRV